MLDILSASSTRIKTGLLILAVVVIIGIIDSYLIIWLLFGSLMIVAIYEAIKLFNIENELIYFYSVGIWILAYFYQNPQNLIFIVAIIFASILAYTKKFDKDNFLLLLYPIAPFLFLLSLYTNFGIGVLFWLLVVVAGADVGAYFTGKSIGKTKFCDTSPNKTLEGVLGGVVIASILGTIFALDNLPFVVAFIISTLVALSSVFGDLFESYLKREADVKDSGNLLPGHGGILDRVDGYLFGAPILFILLKMVM
jgi:phosphatidate cytidylyltransferase